MPPFDTPENFFSLKHLKGGSVQETHALREKQKQALVFEAARFYSDTDPGIGRNDVRFLTMTLDPAHDELTIISTSIMRNERTLL
jgi:hypothetical protein